MNKNFKLQHPSDLISKMFMLEYMRELGAQKLYSKATPEQRKNMFYKFIDSDNETTEIDLNWEALLFECTLLHLEGLLKHFLDEIEEIEEKRIVEQQKILNSDVDKHSNFLESQAPRGSTTDINLMDFAAAKIKENNSNKLII